MNISLLLVVIVFLGTCLSAQSGRDGKAHSRRYRQKLSSLGRVKELGLRKVAEGSAQRAHRAVVIQKLAGQKAALIAKNVLAETAIEAAETAEIALATKAAIINSMDKKRSEAYSDLVLGIAQMNLAKHTAVQSTQTAENARRVREVLGEVLKSEQEFARHAAANAEHSEVMLRAQQTMLNQAKANLENIEKQIEYAHEQLENSRKIAKDAAAAAREALSKVTRVADHLYDSSEHFQANKSSKGKKRKSSYRLAEGEIVAIIGKHGG